MTLSEAKDILVSRIGWDNDKTVTGFVVSPDNAQSDSGRFFQGEHSAVTLQNIRDCQPVPRISEADFNEYLTKLKVQAVTQVLSDTFEKDYVNDKLLTLFPTAFDDAISMRMVIMVGELIMTSTRSNNIERFTDAFVGKLNYDLFREAPNKFAIRGANYNYTLGVATRYKTEIEETQRRFGTQKGRLKTITKGQVYSTYIPEN